MKLKDFKIAWRLLMKEQTHSLIVILGLSLSFSACFLLLGYAKYSFEYDAHIPNPDRIFLVASRMNILSRPIWGYFGEQSLRDSIAKSGIPHISASIQTDNTSVQLEGKPRQPLRLSKINGHFSQLFSVDTVAGDLLGTLAKPDALAITVNTATRIFGHTHVLGKSLQIDAKSYQIGAVIQDPPNNTTVPYETLLGSAEEQSRRYIKLLDNTSVAEVQEFLQRAIDDAPNTKGWCPENCQNLGDRKVIEIKLLSLKNMYFDNHLGNFDRISQQEPIPHGNEGNVVALLMVALCVLFLASLSYVNLAVARTLRRQREIGVYKMLGASRARIVAQFLIESTIISLLSNALGLLIAWLVLPLFSDLMNRQLDSVFTVSSVVMSAIFSIAIGILISVYPTWVALRVNISQALVGRGDKESSAGMRLRRVMTVVQFSLAMGLAALSLAIAWQNHYMTTKTLGFNPENMLVLTLPETFEDPKSKAFRDAVMRLPKVHGAAVSFAPLGRDFVGVNRNFSVAGGRSIAPVMQVNSPNFFELHEVKPLAGRVFDSKLDPDTSTSIIILNEAATHSLGFATPQDAVGQIVSSRGGPKFFDHFRIIGVVPNARYQSARENETPRSYQLGLDASVLNVKVDRNMQEVQNNIAALWQRHFPNAAFDITTSTKLVAENYEEDLRLSKLLVAAAILALLIAAFGIYVLSAYSVQRRTQEIAIRKIYGAKGKAIALLVGKEFASVMLLSALIGLPVGAYAISQYLAGFAERAPIGGWTLLLALLVSVVIAFASTLRHSLLAMKIAPMLALRD